MNKITIDYGKIESQLARPKDSQISLEKVESVLSGYKLAIQDAVELFEEALTLEVLSVDDTATIDRARNIRSIFVKAEQELADHHKSEKATALEEGQFIDKGKRILINQFTKPVKDHLDFQISLAKRLEKERHDDIVAARTNQVIDCTGSLDSPDEYKHQIEYDSKTDWLETMIIIKRNHDNFLLAKLQRDQDEKEKAEAVEKLKIEQEKTRRAEEAVQAERLESERRLALEKAESERKERPLQAKLVYEKAESARKEKELQDKLDAEAAEKLRIKQAEADALRAKELMPDVEKVIEYFISLQLVPRPQFTDVEIADKFDLKCRGMIQMFAEIEAEFTAIITDEIECPF